MNLQDMIYNWLTIDVVLKARPDDDAARETMQLFINMLQEEHRVQHVSYEKKEEWYEVSFMQGEKERSYRFPNEMIEQLLVEIEANPKMYTIKNSDD
ncbi:hypothetical protein [Massilibacterium senegalense]|uniref:hypothetical protein n=1 Tax=Massilibacterium senegalense TaxID=1632858 RepID=UPI0007850A65|nr:hypothetical protein [Massilibacterium senegalense]